MEVKQDLEMFETEVRTVYSELVVSNRENLRSLLQTLYGYMMGVFARLDLYSSYWKGSTESRGQTKRMVQFMSTYLSQDLEANAVAVQLWRHKLMHTSRPRAITDQHTGISYYWLLHWWERLPLERHYTFTNSSGRRILNLGLVYLIEDLRRSSNAYFSEVGSSSELQKRLASAKNELGSYHVTLNV